MENAFDKFCKSLGCPIHRKTRSNLIEFWQERVEESMKKLESEKEIECVTPIGPSHYNYENKINDLFDVLRKFEGKKV